MTVLNVSRKKTKIYFKNVLKKIFNAQALSDCKNEKSTKKNKDFVWNSLGTEYGSLPE